jgi:hypothetical protein
VAYDLSSIKRNKDLKPPRIMVYGVEGIGKTTFAAGAPKPIFILTEDGLGSIEVDHFPLMDNTDAILDAISTLYNDAHDYETVVIDSLDWLDNIIQREIAEKHSEKDLAYGKGAVIAANLWKNILSGLNALRDDKGMAIVCLAHTTIRRFDSPETDSYDRYQPKLQERSGAVIREWADAVLFANYKTIVKKEDVGFNQTSNRGISTGERLLFTSERPAYIAKNRYSLPDSIPMNWNELVKLMTKENKNG